MYTTMISFNYCSQRCTSRLSQLCLPLWFHLTIIYKDVQAGCLHYVYHYDFVWLLFTRMSKQIVSIMFTTMISFNNCSQGCTTRLSKLCFPLLFHLTIVHKDVQADCLNYVYHHDFLYLFFTRMYKQIVQIMFTTMISLNIVYKDVQADCLNYVYHYDFI